MEYAPVGDLPLTIDSVSFERRERETTSGFTRATTVLTLEGDGHWGRGEDVTYDLAEHAPERWERLDLSLAGSWSFDSLSRRLATLSLFPAPPDRAVFENYRRWGLESAALSLALRQAGTTLGDVLGETYDPVRFLVSTRLADEGESPTAERVTDWLALDPALEFKLDVTPEWTDDLAATLAETAAVRVLDCKGHYEGTEVETTLPAARYAHLLEIFPDAVLEDPAVTDDTRPLLEPHADRVSWDAPVHDVADLEAMPFDPAWLNVKPSRFGSFETLFDVLAYCEAHDVSLYAGGQFELDVGRAHSQALASLWFAEAPNDIAPTGYNVPEPPTDLPGSPLRPPDDPVGIGWEPAQSAR